MDMITQAFLDRTPRSRAHHDRARAVMPGGDSRASAHHPPHPIVFRCGTGAWLTDVDDNDHLDLLGNYTSLVHGNAYPPVTQAAQRAAADGSAWAGPNSAQVDLARQIVDRVASVEAVRFTNSGTEAAMLAIHLAKALTGRTRVLMAQHGYHGSHEDTQAGTYAGTRDEPLFGGPDGQGHATLVAPFGDAYAFETVLQDREDVAAVLLEPAQGSCGLTTAPPAFFQRVAAAAARAGALFVLDEVITFRMSPGGAQQLLDIQPDLTLLGKLVGGGYPVGAVGGRASVLTVTDPARPGGLRHTGTFNGNPVTAAAGAVALSHLTTDRICWLDESATRVEHMLHRHARRRGLPMASRRAGSVLSFALEDSLGNAMRRRADPRTAAFHLACAVHGLHLAPRGMLATSTVLTEDDLVEADVRIGRAMAMTATA